MNLYIELNDVPGTKCTGHGMHVYVMMVVMMMMTMMKAMRVSAGIACVCYVLRVLLFVWAMRGNY